MVNEENLSYAIIGRNLSAISALEHLLKKGSLSSQFHWFQTPQDREEAAQKRWLYSPVGQRFRENDGLDDSEMMIFLDSKTRYPLSTFLRLKDLHPALLKKIFAVALWNDHSPNPWRAPGEPNPYWTARDPISISAQQNWAPALVPLHKALSIYESQFQASGVRVSPSDKVVLSLKAPEGNGPHTLVHNAPYEVTRVNRILSFDADFTQFQPLGRWRSTIALVKRASVAAIPKFSLYLDPKLSRDFWNYGLLKTGALKRVLKVQEDSQHCWLQIENLEVIGEGEISTDARPDAFLWNLCPYLELETPHFKSFSNNESVVFDSIGALQEKFMSGAHRVFLGPLLRPDELRVDGIQ